MRIVVDEDIPFAAQAFAGFGEVHALPAREMNASALRRTDALIVRSVTRVNAALLDGTGVRFVGSATAGTDHVDLAYLRRREIAFSDALGANANTVAEYVLAALLHLRDCAGLEPSGSSLGIIGFGHVGRRVAHYAAALGLRVVINDPPLARSTCEPLYRPLDEVLQCDVVTLHVPLEHGGTDPTYHLVSDAFLGAMKPGSFLINAARGAVADTAALKRAIDAGRLGGLVLDVWENEPAIDTELARRCLIATAHIAGHSLDAKIAVLGKLVSALARFCKIPASWNGPETTNAEPRMCESLSYAVRGAFDIKEADARLRDTFALPAADRAAAFDALRAGWPSRREFHVRPIVLEAGDSTEMTILGAIGFRAAALAEGAPR